MATTNLGRIVMEAMSIETDLTFYLVNPMSRIPDEEIPSVEPAFFNTGADNRGDG